MNFPFTSKPNVYIDYMKSSTVSIVFLEKHSTLIKLRIYSFSSGKICTKRTLFFNYRKRLQLNSLV